MTLAPKLTFFAVAITLAVSTQVAGAGGLQVSPTRAFLTAKAKTSAIEISNDGTTTSRLQATAYRWTQSASGEVVLKPTSDIVVYPSLFSIEPGSERNIRIGTKKVAVAPR
jgi:fimbrial chaperone protein